MGRREGTGEEVGGEEERRSKRRSRSKHSRCRGNGGGIEVDADESAIGNLRLDFVQECSRATGGIEDAKGRCGRPRRIEHAQTARHHPADDFRRGVVDSLRPLLLTRKLWLIMRGRKAEDGMLVRHGAADGSGCWRVPQANLPHGVRQ